MPEPRLSSIGLNGRVRLNEGERPITPISALPFASESGDRDILAVGVIPSSQTKLTTVRRATPLPTAQALMIRYDYSQLPVVDQTGTKLRGVLSWESMARASIASNPKIVNDCMRSAVTVAIESDLFDSIPAIVDAGYVIVLDPRGGISGIVTTADLANQFDSLARPFLLVGECERELRILLDSRFPSDLLEKASRWAAKNGQSGAAAMTLGEIKVFLSKPDNWAALGLPLPKDIVIDWIGVLTQLRNQVAHFHADAEEIAPQLLQVRTLTSWLRTLEKTSNQPTE